ncbi:hypothetical protein CA7LBN_004803 [Candidozyma auris]|uniref:Chromosome transmission fidelity protein 8 n=1 Tax=Candidozyma auris TaxID=498019 RepID=A0A8F2W534_CANAR|nr:hypothetical protein CA7LBN_004803 [[Candida] auris]
MPSTEIDFTPAKDALDNSEVFESDGRCIVSSSQGLLLLDIQGELSLPEEEYPAVKFGHLEFDEINKSRVTLIIGKSQRLLGKIEDLPKPMGVLRVPVSKQDEQNTESVEILDVIYKKLLFDMRPLPIM